MEIDPCAAERTMREAQWILTDELFLPERPEPAEVAAFRVLQEDDWMHFIEQVSGNPALKFFNPEVGEYSGAADWAALAEERGIKPFHADFAIPNTLNEKVHRFCRALRNRVRHDGGTGYGGGCIAFHDPRTYHYYSLGVKCVLVIEHDGGELAPYFNEAYEDSVALKTAAELMDLYGLWSDSVNPAVTALYFR